MRGVIGHILTESEGKNGMKEMQHYVPACYLANFGIDGNKGRESHVYYFCVNDGTTCIKRVDDVAIENGFYNVEKLGNQSRIIEEFYANVLEPQLSQLLLKIVDMVEENPMDRKKNYLDLSGEERDAFSAQMAFQYIRTKSFRDRYVYLYKHIKEGFPWVSFPNYSRKDFRRIHTMEILEFRSSNFFANLFSDRHWVVLINHTKTPFVTSDAPVIQIYHKTKRGETLSPVSPKVTMFFPLSPAIAIEIYEKNIVKEDMRYFDIYLQQTINWYNYKEMENCSRVVLSNVSFDVLKYREVRRKDGE